jgi:hypothetical protein
MKNKIILADTLYITMKVVERSLQQNPDLHVSIKDEFVDLQRHLRQVLDIVDMAETAHEKENLKAG